MTESQPLTNEGQVTALTDMDQAVAPGPVAASHAARTGHRPPPPATGVAATIRDITTVEDEVFRLAEHTLVDTLHLTGRVATVAVSESTHVLGSVVRGVMHILTRTLPKGSDLRSAYSMTEVVEEVLPEVEEVLPLL